MDNKRLNVDVEGMPVQLAPIDGREGFRNDGSEYSARNANGMPLGISSSPEDSQERIVEKDSEMEESKNKVTPRHGSMTAKITV